MATVIATSADHLPNAASPRVAPRAVSDGLQAGSEMGAVLVVGWNHTLTRDRGSRLRKVVQPALEALDLAPHVGQFPLHFKHVAHLAGTFEEDHQLLLGGPQVAQPGLDIDKFRGDVLRRPVLTFNALGNIAHP